MDAQGLDEPEYDIARVADRDRFDKWTVTREQRISCSRSNQCFSPDVVGRKRRDGEARRIRR